MEVNDAVTSLMQTLLPGGAGFPSAQEAGVAPLLVERLCRADRDFPAKLRNALASQVVTPDSSVSWIEAACRLEVLEPKLFAEFRQYAYLTYYEQPLVIAAIRALGFRYNAQPLPEGYPDERFDPAGDAPGHNRGRWLKTGDVRRVDLSGLDLESLR